MTIAIGFAYDSGLLFCVDTKVTTNIKTNETKIVYFASDDGLCRIAFAMSSTDMNFPRMAVQRCWDHVKGMDFQSVSLSAVHNAAEFALAEFYRDHIYPHPDRTPGAIFLELLVGVWLRGDTNLYVSHETVLTPVDQYECIGSGAYLAKYLVRQYLKATGDDITEQDAGLIANFAVEQAIEYDEYCGGEAEMLIMRNSGTLDSICPSVIYPSSQFIANLQQHTWRLVRDLAAMTDYSKASSQRIVQKFSAGLGIMHDADQGLASLRQLKETSPHRWD